jgi:hypothetical protein
MGLGDRSERELDGAESGIGDHDGLLKQVGTQDWQQGSMGRWMLRNVIMKKEYKKPADSRRRVLL